MMMEADCYGLHWDGAVAWLVQGRGGTNFVGLRGNCPFRARGMCNHLVPTAAPIPDRIQWELFAPLMKDPLVKALLPVPHPPGQNLYFVESQSPEIDYYLTTLSRLSSPIQSVVRPAWMIKQKDLEREVYTSNIQPLIVTQTDTRSQPLVDFFRKMAGLMPRTVVISGRPEIVTPAPIQRIETKITEVPLDVLMSLPMENLGAAVIRRTARREEIDAPMESRQDRRQRMINERETKS